MRVTQRLPQMRRPVLVLTATVSLAFAVAVYAADDLVLDRFGAYLDSLRTQASIPGLAAAIIGSNNVLREFDFGSANVDRSVTVRADTPFHLDGLTQIWTAALVLYCVEEGKISLDDSLGEFSANSSEPDATVRQVLSHTSSGLVFSYRPERLDLLIPPLSVCFDQPFRRAMADMLEKSLMMADSVPGPDAATPAASDGVDQGTIDRYKRALDRMATGYVTNGSTPSPAAYSAQTLKPSTGLITSVRDFANFDLGLKKGTLLRTDSIAAAWTPPLGANGRRLPHGLGWFVQSYNGETVVWQFGAGSASSSMVITVPSRGLTLVLLANSNGLARGFNLTAGDVSVSPFAKAFLGTFLR
jgi:CubicO group peptidase (beta-lactamase class C family)